MSPTAPASLALATVLSLAVLGCAPQPSAPPAVLRPAQKPAPAPTAAKPAPPASEAGPGISPGNPAVATPPQGPIAPVVPAQAPAVAPAPPGLTATISGVVLAPVSPAPSAGYALLAAGEAPAAGVPVEVLVGNGARVISTTTTDANGRFAVSGLPRGRTYQVRARVQHAGKEVTLRSLAGVGEAEATKTATVTPASTFAAAQLLKGVQGEAMALLQGGAFDGLVQALEGKLGAADLAVLNDEAQMLAVVARLQQDLGPLLKDLERLSAQLGPGLLASGTLAVLPGVGGLPDGLASQTLGELLEGLGGDEDEGASLAIEADVVEAP
ncbi:MAG: hypothetical protein VKS61_11820 [Candidatus Sericytochromatia bacterium]|nr:hypothetical protein [Candidatus Sericytochromatia bacterium]